MPVCLLIFLFSMTTGITFQSSVCRKVLTSITRSMYFSILSTYSLLSTLSSPGHVTSTILHTFLPLCTCNDNMQEVMLQMFICLHSDVPQDFQIFIFSDNYYHYYHHYYHCHFVIFWNI